MKLSFFKIGSIVIGLALAAGCEKDDDKKSTGTTDASSTSGASGGATGVGGNMTGAGGTAMAKGGSGAGGSVVTGAGGSGVTGAGGSGAAKDAGAPAGAKVTYDGDIKTIVMAKCATGGCHGSSSNNLGLDHMKRNPLTGLGDCPTGKVDACMVTRVKKGAMPYNKMCKGIPAMDTANPACLNADQMAKMEAWAAGGYQ